MSFHDFMGNEARSLTHSQLLARIQTLGHAISDVADPGDRIPLIFPASLAFFEWFLACMHAGAVPVPVAPPLSAGDVAHGVSIANDVGARRVVAADACMSGVEGAFPPGMVFRAETLGSAHSGAAITTPPRPRDDDIAVIQYTSGSIGEPKGVMISHGNLLANQAMLMHAGQMRRDDVMAGWAPHYHDLGLMSQFMLSIYSGCALHYFDVMQFVRSPMRWLQFLSDTRATHSAASQFAFRLCNLHGRRRVPKGLDLSNLRWIHNGGEPIQWDEVERFIDLFAPSGLGRTVVVPSYGLAETTVYTAAALDPARRGARLDVDRDGLLEGRVVPPRTDADRQTLVSCGIPAVGSTIRIVDPGTRMDLGEDQVGEVWIAGPHVALGYWNKPEATQATFGQMIENAPGGPGYLKTGDLGLLHGGELYVTGRLKDMIIIRGKNYYPNDLEHCVEAASPHIRQGRIAAVPVSYLGQETVAIIAEIGHQFSVAKDAALLTRQIRHALAQNFQIAPSAIILVARHSLPRTTSGKIQRRKIRQMLDDGRFQILFEDRQSPTEQTAFYLAGYPHGGAGPAIEEWLFDTLSSAAGTSLRDPGQTLFEIGLDSLWFTEFLIELEELTGMDLVDRVIGDAPTIAALAQILAGNGASVSVPAPTAKQSGPAAPRRGLGQDIKYRLVRLGPVWRWGRVPYGAGSAVLDQALKIEGLARALHPRLHDRFEQAVAEICPENPRQAVFEGVRASTWVTWREQAMADSARFAACVEVSGDGPVREALARGQGVIFAMVHSQLKGLLKFLPVLEGKPLGAVANLPADRLEFYGTPGLGDLAGDNTAQTVPAVRVAQLRSARAILERGGVVGVLMDSYEGQGGITVPFFNRMRPIRPGIADLALKTGALIVPVDQRLLDHGRVRIRLMEPIVGQGDRHADQVTDILLKQNQALAAMWRDNMGQMDIDALNFQLALPPIGS